MKILQVVPNLAYGDGVGNDILAMNQILIKNNYETGVYAIVIDKRIEDGIARSFEEFPELNSDDIVILHLAVGSEINKWFSQLSCKRIIVYHNITPSHFFSDYDKNSEKACDQGLKEVKKLCNSPDYCLADSEYNRNDLLQYHFKCKIDVLPILIPFQDYDKAPDQKLLTKYNDDYTNVVFTGRIVPNKKQEDIILAFYYYQKYYNPKSRLFLVGSYGTADKYYNRLVQFVDQLGVQNVVFTGHIKFNEILAYYHLAHVFLCTSEHEGFCIPLIEAMHFRIPVIACDYAAVGETMGDAGLVCSQKDPLLLAGIMNRIITDETLREDVIAGQDKRLEFFAQDKVETDFMRYLKNFISDSDIEDENEKNSIY